MDLHLHLSVAFRALDYKWGKPVDLDTSDDGSTCPPAFVDHSFTTFSSEDYLRVIKKEKKERPKPYSRKRSECKDDSLINISAHRIPSVSDLGGSVSLLNTSGFSEESVKTDYSEATSLDRGFVSTMHNLIQDMERPLEESVEDFTESSTALEAAIRKKKKQLDGIFDKLKSTAFAFVEEKYRKKR